MSTLGGYQRIRSAGVLLALVWALVGCQAGNNVPVEGQLLVESKPVNQGQLFLTPVDGGSSGYGEVGTDGRFELRSTGGGRGVPPGRYRVLFRQTLDQNTRRQMERRGKGSVRVDEMTLTYRGPAAEPIVIPESGSQQLVVDVRRDLGWERVLDD